MKLSDWVLGSKWALVGGIAALGVVGLRVAIAQDKLARPLPPPEGLKVTGKYEPGDWPQMRFAATFQNTSAVQREVRGTATLVKTVFKGNPLSRVMLPGDREASELEQRAFQFTLKAGGERLMAFVFETKPEEPAREPGLPRVSYSLRLMTDDGRLLHVVGANPPPVRPGGNRPSSK